MIKSSTALADVLKEQIILLSPIIDFLAAAKVQRKVKEETWSRQGNDKENSLL